jgi:hypothetical protein
MRAARAGGPAGGASRRGASARGFVTGATAEQREVPSAGPPTWAAGCRRSRIADSCRDGPATNTHDSPRAPNTTLIRSPIPSGKWPMSLPGEFRRRPPCRARDSNVCKAGRRGCLSVGRRYRPLAIRDLIKVVLTTALHFLIGGGGGSGFAPCGGSGVCGSGCQPPPSARYRNASDRHCSPRATASCSSCWNNCWSATRTSR